MFNLELAWNKPAKTWNQSTDHVLRVQIRPQSNTVGLPLRMAIALDTSSSMQGEKLTAAKETCRSVVAQLRKIDRLELASFSTQVQPLLKSLAGGSEALDAANTAITKLQASGVTRTDMALEWIQKTLPEEKGVVRVGILITDGHATTSQGAILSDVTALLDKAAELSKSGILIYPVGLGNASNFNNVFLIDLGNRGQGEFIYAETPSELQPKLRERLTASQAIAIDDAQIQFTPKSEVTLKAFCRFRPDYLPLEETAKGKLNIGVIRTDTPTDILVKVEIPKLGVGESLGSRELLQVELTATNLSKVSGKASILYTKSATEAEQLNNDVDNNRKLWEIKENMNSLIRENDPKRTRQLLDRLEIDTLQDGLSELAEQVAQLKNDLEKTGKVDEGRKTRAWENVQKS
ncbi:vWA domain-containing protein [Laspinema olomoucense]|uniref:VWA domain-containing protein n=1 Tax=Laspinema olomoucense D3b TaxID=2953688 RepID=A0ABT2NAX8_9CYAN|nr:VWA domain-containing protein [Laspinema sp. D3b]MCT7978989.1 VWA domain-containing protein [Laspinema sp. D3b]